MRSLQSTTLLFTSHQYNFRICRIPSRIGSNHQLNIYKWKSQACCLGSLEIKVVRFVLLCVKYDYWEVAYVLPLYRQMSNISRTLGNKVVNHPDAVEHRCSNTSLFWTSVFYIRGLTKFFYDCSNVQRQYACRFRRSVSTINTRGTCIHIIQAQHFQLFPFLKWF